MDFDEWLSVARGTAESFYASQGISNPDVVKLSHYFFNHFVDHDVLRPKIYPDVRPVLEGLDSDLIKAVISAHPEVSLQQEASEYGVREYFDLIRGNILNKKIGLRELSEEADFNPENAIYVGDTQFDMESALASGYIPFGIGKKIEGHGGKFRGYNSPERLREITDNVYDTLYDLIPFIEKQNQL